MLDAVRRIAADSRDSFHMIETLRRDLQEVADALRSIAGLADSAADGVGQAEASLSSALELGSDTARRSQAIVAASSSLKQQVDEVALLLTHFPSSSPAASGSVEPAADGGQPGASPPELEDLEPADEG